MSKKYLLGIDIGTYSSKGVLVTLDGRIEASHITEHSISNPKPGWFEQDADQVWWNDFVIITKNILKKSEIHPDQILCIGTSGIGSCVLPIDKDGKPLRPGILYGIDTRAMDEIEFLNKTLGKENIFKHCGSHLTSQASGPKVLWIRNHEPEIFKKTRWFLTSQAYLVYKLTGKPIIDIYTAGDYVPLFDVNQFHWMKETEKYITEITKLPDFHWSHEIVGQVNKESSLQTGLMEGTPVIAGTTDAASEAISSGVSKIGDMMIMFGSSVFFIVKTSQLNPTQSFWTSNFLEKKSYVNYGGMSTTGSITRWFRDQFGQPELAKEEAGEGSAYELLAKLASTSSCGANGLVALPYFAGERTPINDPKAKGVIFGLSLKHTRADIYRALLESVAYGIRHVIEVMHEESVLADRIFAVGGGTKNLNWMQMVSDINGISMNIPEYQIGASYGDAFMAGVGIGVFRNITEITKWVRIKAEIKPGFEGDNRNYELNYSIYRNLYKNTASLMHQLSEKELNR